MKFCQILVCLWQTFLTYFCLNAGNWELVPGAFIILLKWRYSKIWPFLIVDIYYFWMSLIHLFKKMKHWNLDIICYWVIGAGCEIEKDLELSPQSSKLFKWFLKIIVLIYKFQLAKFANFMSCGSKDILKNTTCLLFITTSQIW